jgi:hypothetical protein
MSGRWLGELSIRCSVSKSSDKSTDDHHSRSTIAATVFDSLSRLSKEVHHIRAIHEPALH